MEEDFSLDYEFTESNTAKKPAFVVVLCILTFVGSGLAVLANIYYGATYNAQIKTFELMNEVQSKFGTNQINPLKFVIGDINSFKTAIYWHSVLNWVKFFIHIPIILGAVFMYKLKRKGFYMHVAGQFSIIIVNIIICMKVNNIGFMSYSYMIYPIIGIIGSVAFLIMYSTNLKHFK